ncbi:restriction endonuclease subunit S [Hoyosella subflava]|uniref:Restriction modification system DNA specificity domain protein n=1 Tax=Hoyosella subflava (strain DSM 45089 / JCM 17490 / NBRC 109087 / DQS3-9A1) TaxID=443218 RepID=F6ESM2_HOYSD|nr:restriction endonuclease subunit S [Hoyosella subflava]AEF43143.1 Restriction modification system DNA specificity domain protein [Hoyosella subflava DQS3-9A1]
MSDWRTTTLGEIVDVLDSLRCPINSEERSKRLGDVPYYGANGQQGWIDKPLFDEPLILLAEDGGNFDDYARRPIAYRITGPSWVNNHAHIIRAVRGNDQNFVYWSLVHRDIRRFISGGTRTKLTQAEMRSIELKIPEYEEQRRIAEILDTLDDQIRATEQIIAKLKLARAGLMADLVERDDHRHSDRHCIADLVAPGQFGSAIGPFGSNLVASDYRNYGVPVVFVRDIQSGVFDSKSQVFVSPRKARELNSHRTDPGDVLVTKMGDPPGTAALHPADFPSGVITADIIRIRPNGNIVLPEWLVMYINSLPVKQQIGMIAAGVTRQKLTLADFRKVTIALPGIDIQHQVAERVASADHLIAQEKSRLEKSQILKVGLMSDLLAGRVRVPLEAAS